MTLTVKELLNEYIDIDVYDDYDERIGIAFCGPAQLTSEGEKYFADVFDTEVDIFRDIAILHIEDNVKRLKMLKELFYALAGYCSISQYEEWFKEA